MPAAIVHGCRRLYIQHFSPLLFNIGCPQGQSVPITFPYGAFTYKTVCPRFGHFRKRKKDASPIRTVTQNLQCPQGHGKDIYRVLHGRCPFFVCFAVPTLFFFAVVRRERLFGAFLLYACFSPPRSVFFASGVLCGRIFAADAVFFVPAFLPPSVFCRGGFSVRTVCGRV